MCQLDYAAYAQEPWALPMGGLLNQHSGCDEGLSRNVENVRLSVLEEALEESSVPPLRPTGFIFHETRCGSTLAANMLALVPENLVWSESTAPWRVTHVCPECSSEKIAGYLRILMGLMGRSRDHKRLFFKLQNADNILILTQAFPDTPWVFLFRDPVEIMVSRMGGQRVGMEGVGDPVAERFEKRTEKEKSVGKSFRQISPEDRLAQTLAGLCDRAIRARRDSPDTGMVLDYSHMPDAMLSTIVPHFGISPSAPEVEIMLGAESKYSKAPTIEVVRGAHPVDNDQAEGAGAGFTDDTETKSELATPAVMAAAEKYLEKRFEALRALQPEPFLVH